MWIPAAICGFVLLVLVLADAFVTMVVPRRTRHVLQIAHPFYRYAWVPFAAIGRRISVGRAREEFLSLYGPLSLLALFVIWASGLILAFALLQWAAGIQPQNLEPTFPNALYISATTLATLSSGNPVNGPSKLLTAVEGAIGISFLGLVIGYLPVLYQAFATREVRISLMDARAGSPPSARDLLLSLPRSSDRLASQLASWETWIAELLESQLSYPMLSYFRSHHSNQSWLTSLVAILDTSSVVVLCSHDDLKLQANLTFALGRHALADICAELRLDKDVPAEDRLNAQRFETLREQLRQSPSALAFDAMSYPALADLRKMYEPLAGQLSTHFMMSLPPWLPTSDHQENWRSNGPPPDIYAVSDPFQKEKS